MVLPQGVCCPIWQLYHKAVLARAAAHFLHPLVNFRDIMGSRAHRADRRTPQLWTVHEIRYHQEMPSSGYNLSCFSSEPVKKDPPLQQSPLCQAAGKTEYQMLLLALRGDTIVLRSVTTGV